MARTVKCGLIQAKHAGPTDVSIEEIKRANIEKHLAMIADAAKQGVLALQRCQACRHFQHPPWRLMPS